MVDMDQEIAALREFAVSNGIDYEAELKKAADRCASNGNGSSMEPSEEEIDSLVMDDLSSYDGRVPHVD